MLILPDPTMPLLIPFRPLFHRSTWAKALILLNGAILAVGKPTGTSALRVVGLSAESSFAKYHHVLNRAVWSPYRVAEVLLTLLMQYLDEGEGPLVFGIDDTIERRWDPKIAARGIYRDAVRSSQRHFVKTSGLRWDAALFEPAPPYSGVGRPRKKGKRLPSLEAVLNSPQTVWQTVNVALYDNQPRTLEIASDTAIWYHAGKPAVPMRWVLVRDPQGVRETVALVSTDPNLPAVQIVTWFAQRWRIEVTFEEARAHLGVETQRQWSDTAIARTTPALLGLFSWTTLATHLLVQQHPVSVRQATWYVKVHPTFSDAISWVRQAFWFPASTFRMSPQEADMVKIPRPLLDRLIETVCYAT